MLDFLTTQIQDAFEFVNKECCGLEEWTSSPLFSITSNWSNMDLSFTWDRNAFHASVELAKWVYEENKERYKHFDAYITILLSTGMHVSCTLLEIMGED